MMRFLKKIKKKIPLICVFTILFNFQNGISSEKIDNKSSLILEQIKNQIEELSLKVAKLSNDVENIKFNKNLENKENNSALSEINKNENYFSENKSNEFDVLNEEDDIYQNTSSISLDIEQNNFLQKSSSFTKIEDLYFNSMEKFRSNNFEESELLLEKILNASWEKSDKNLEIKANSHFLIAEIFYKKPDFEKSASNFLKAYQLFSKINKTHVQAGNSLLRLGQTLYASGNKNAACKSFIKLNSDFKELNNSLSKISENEIAKLKCLKK